MLNLQYKLFSTTDFGKLVYQLRTDASQQMSTTTSTLQTTHNDVNKPTNRPTNNRRIETDQWLLTNSTRVFQPITSRLNRPITFNRPDFITSSTDNYSSLDSEDDFRTGCRNVSHQQQFFSELHSPGRSHYTNYLNRIVRNGIVDVCSCCDQL